MLRLLSRHPLLLQRIIKFLLLTCIPLALADADISTTQILNARSSYDVFGLKPGASKAEVQKKYVELMRKYHDDANHGDPLALSVVSKVNNARDQIQKNSNLKRPSVKAQTPQATPVNNAGSIADLALFYAKMKDKNNSADDRLRLRLNQLKKVLTASDFVAVATGGVAHLSLAMAQEARAFAESHIVEFLALHPTLKDLSELTQWTGSAREAQLFYRRALAGVKTAEDFLRLIKPIANSRDGDGWSENLKAAVREEVKRFFQMSPSVDQVDRLRMNLRMRYPQAEIETIFPSVSSRSSARGGTWFGFLRGFLSKVARTLSLNPTLMTGSAVSYVENKEMEAYQLGTCPQSLVLSGARALTADFVNMLALGPEDVREFVLEDCRRKSPESEELLRKALEHLKESARSKLSGDGNRANCEKSQDRLTMDFMFTNGLKAQIFFDSRGGLRRLEITPQAGQGNANYFMDFTPDNTGRGKIEYCALAVNSEVPRENRMLVSESESSFLVRQFCTVQICSHEEFLNGTTTADMNHFYWDLNKAGTDEKNPFGELDHDFLTRASDRYLNIMIVLRMIPENEFSYGRACQEFGLTPPEPSPQALPAQGAPAALTGSSVSY